MQNNLKIWNKRWTIKDFMDHDMKVVYIMSQTNPYVHVLICSKITWLIVLLPLFLKEYNLIWT